LIGDKEDVALAVDRSPEVFTVIIGILGKGLCSGVVAQYIGVELALVTLTVGGRVTLPRVVKKQLAIGFFDHPMDGIEIMGEQALGRTTRGGHRIAGKAVVAPGSKVDGL